MLGFVGRRMVVRVRMGMRVGGSGRVGGAVVVVMARRMVLRLMVRLQTRRELSGVLVLRCWGDRR